MLLRVENGLYAASEYSTIAVGRSYQPGVKRGVIYCHGSGTDGRALQTFPGVARLVAEDYGLAIASADLGGTKNWGNDTSGLRLTDIWTYLIAQTGCLSDKVLLFGNSMGNVTALNWARTHISSVAAAFCGIPGTDVDAIHAGTIPAGSAFAADVDAAYPGGWAAASATHSPNNFAASTLAGRFPARVAVAASDEFVGPQMGRDLAAALGVSIVEFAGTHSLLSPPFDARDAASFLAKYA